MPIFTDLNARFFVAVDGTVYRKAHCVSPKLRREVSIRDNWLCQYCGVRVARARSSEEMLRWYGVQVAQVDHVLPVRRGGRSDAANLVLACVTCNIHKRDRDNREARAAGAPVLPAWNSRPLEVSA